MLLPSEPPPRGKARAEINQQDTPLGRTRAGAPAIALVSKPKKGAQNRILIIKSSTLVFWGCSVLKQ